MGVAPSEDGIPGRRACTCTPGIECVACRLWRAQERLRVQGRVGIGPVESQETLCDMIDELKATILRQKTSVRRLQRRIRDLRQAELTLEAKRTAVRHAEQQLHQYQELARTVTEDRS